MTFFSHRPFFVCLLGPYLFLLSDIWYIYNRYDPFLDEKRLFQKNFLLATFLLVCSYFATLPITLLLQILGDGCMGRPPSSKSPPMYADADKRIRRDRDTTMETYFSNSFYIALQTEPLSVIDHRLNLA